MKSLEENAEKNKMIQGKELVSAIYDQNLSKNVASNHDWNDGKEGSVCKELETKLLHLQTVQAEQIADISITATVVACLLLDISAVTVSFQHSIELRDSKTIFPNAEECYRSTTKL